MERHKILFGAVLWLSALGRAQGPAQSPTQSLDSDVRSAAAGFQGKLSVFAKNLDSGKTYGLGADDPVRTASTIKLPILAAAFAAVTEGNAAWTDIVPLREGDKISGSGVLTEFPDDTPLPLSGLAHLMIVVSDNTATNLVLDRISPDYVNQQLDKL